MFLEQVYPDTVGGHHAENRLLAWVFALLRLSDQRRDFPVPWPAEDKRYSCVVPQGTRGGHAHLAAFAWAAPVLLLGVAHWELWGLPQGKTSQSVL